MPRARVAAFGVVGWGSCRDTAAAAGRLSPASSRSAMARRHRLALQGDALNALISDEYNVASRRTDPKAASSVPDPVAPVVDDLPQGLADTVADLIGKPRARGWIHLCSAVTATMGGLALVAVAGIASSQKAILATLIYTLRKTQQMPRNSCLRGGRLDRVQQRFGGLVDECVEFSHRNRVLLAYAV